MRNAAFAILLLLAGCAKEKYDKPSPAPLVRDEGAGVVLDLSAPPALKKKSGVLAVPVRVVNERPDPVFVVLGRCLLEEASGERRRRASNDRKRLEVDPGRRRDFKLVYGTKDAPLKGDSFRIYIWLEDGNGHLIEGLKPLVLQGDAAFVEPPRPFYSRTPRTPEQDFPPVEDWSGRNAARSRELAPCGFCSEPRGDARVCPSCHDGDGSD